MGTSAAVFFSDHEFYSDLLTLYFTDYEPESCFVAEHNCQVVGYLLGSLNTISLDRVTVKKIVPRLLGAMLTRGVLCHRKNLVFLWHIIVSLVRGEFACADYSREYPATLHINLRQGYRGSGVGGVLIERYIALLRQRGISGVRLATYSEKAGEFFAKHGFVLLSSHRRTYFRYFLGKDIHVYIYGRKL
jgi:GNAT superfamily N-acetyltransferase